MPKHVGSMSQSLNVKPRFVKKRIYWEDAQKIFLLHPFHGQLLLFGFSGVSQPHNECSVAMTSEASSSSPRTASFPVPAFLEAEVQFWLSRGVPEERLQRSVRHGSSSLKHRVVKLAFIFYCKKKNRAATVWIYNIRVAWKSPETHIKHSSSGFATLRHSSPSKHFKSQVFAGFFFAFCP